MENIEENKEDSKCDLGKHSLSQTTSSQWTN